MRVLIDTNVILDVLQSREPWHKEGQTIFLAVANHVMTGWITAKQAADIHFFRGSSLLARKIQMKKPVKYLRVFFHCLKCLIHWQRIA